MILSTKLEAYVLDIIDTEDPLLYDLNRETHIKAVHPRMISGHIQGQILQMISKMCMPDNILEIGTFTGYSTICLSKGLKPGGHIHTIEINDEIVEIPLKYFERAGIKDNVTLHTGNALDIIPSLNVLFDLVFIDADKSQYLQYYHAAFEKTKPGGYIIADNILWSGKVISDVEQGDHFTKGIMNFNEFIKNDSRIEKTILPIRDGIMLMRKK